MNSFLEILFTVRPSLKFKLMGNVSTQGSNIFEEDLFDYQGRQMKEPLIINFLDYCFDQSSEWAE